MDPPPERSISGTACQETIHVPFLERTVAAGDPPAVQQHVESPIPVHGGPHHSLRTGAVRHVAYRRRRLPAALSDLRCRLQRVGLAQVRHHYAGALARERLGGRPSYPGPPARYEGNLPFESHRIAPVAALIRCPS